MHSFRWVSLQLAELRKCKRPSHVRKTLKGLPKTLDETYARILGNIPEMYVPEVSAALRWLACSLRPLSVKELAEAAVIDPQADPPFDPKDQLQQDSILEMLSGLVTTEPAIVGPDSGLGSSEGGGANCWPS